MQKLVFCLAMVHIRSQRVVDLFWLTNFCQSVGKKLYTEITKLYILDISEGKPDSKAS